jgi:hypothetical protein
MKHFQMSLACFIHLIVPDEYVKEVNGLSFAELLSSVSRSHPATGNSQYAKLRHGADPPGRTARKGGWLGGLNGHLWGDTKRLSVAKLRSSVPAVAERKCGNDRCPLFLNLS